MTACAIDFSELYSSRRHADSPENSKSADDIDSSRYLNSCLSVARDLSSSIKVTLESFALVEPLVLVNSNAFLLILPAES